MKHALQTLGVMLLASAPAQAIEIDFSGSVSMGLTGSNGPSGAAISPLLGLETRFDFSVETDGGLTIGLTLPVSAEGTSDGWSLRISDQ